MQGEGKDEAKKNDQIFKVFANSIKDLRKGKSQTAKRYINNITLPNKVKDSLRELIQVAQQHHQLAQQHHQASKQQKPLPKSQKDAQVQNSLEKKQQQAGSMIGLIEQYAEMIVTGQPLKAKELSLSVKQAGVRGALADIAELFESKNRAQSSYAVQNAFYRNMLGSLAEDSESITEHIHKQMEKYSQVDNDKKEQIITLASKIEEIKNNSMIMLSGEYNYSQAELAVSLKQQAREQEASESNSYSIIMEQFELASARVNQLEAKVQQLQAKVQQLEAAIEDKDKRIAQKEKKTLQKQQQYKNKVLQLQQNNRQVREKFNTADASTRIFREQLELKAQQWSQTTDELVKLQLELKTIILQKQQAQARALQRENEASQEKHKMEQQLDILRAYIGKNDSLIQQLQKQKLEAQHQTRNLRDQLQQSRICFVQNIGRHSTRGLQRAQYSQIMTEVMLIAERMSAISSRLAQQEPLSLSNSKQNANPKSQYALLNSNKLALVYFQKQFYLDVLQLQCLQRVLGRIAQLTILYQHPQQKKTNFKTLLASCHHILLLALTEQNKVVGSYSCPQLPLKQQKSLLFSFAGGQLVTFPLKEHKEGMSCEQDYLVFGNEELYVEQDSLQLYSNLVKGSSSVLHYEGQQEERELFLSGQHVRWPKSQIKMLRYAIFSVELQQCISRDE